MSEQNGSMAMQRSIASSPGRSCTAAWQAMAHFLIQCLEQLKWADIGNARAWLGEASAVACPLLAAHELEDGSVVLEIPGLKIGVRPLYGASGAGNEDLSMPSLAMVPQAGSETVATLTFFTQNELKDNSLLAIAEKLNANGAFQIRFQCRSKDQISHDSKLGDGSDDSANQHDGED